MTNPDIVALTKKGIGDSVIVDLIRVRGSDFRLQASDIVALADSGVTDPVIDAMIQTSHSAEGRDRAGGYITYPAYPLYVYDPWWYDWWWPYSSGWWLGFSYWPHAYAYGHYEWAPSYWNSGGHYAPHAGGRRR